MIRGNTFIDTAGLPMISLNSSEAGYRFDSLGQVDANRYCAPYGEPMMRHSRPDVPWSRQSLTLGDWRRFGYDASATVCPLTLPEFAETGAGTQRVANGSFTSGVGGWVAHPGGTSLTRTDLLGGALQFNRGPLDALASGNVSTTTGPMAAGEYVRVAWRGLRPGGEARVMLYLMRNAPPWDIVARSPQRVIGSDPRSYVQYLRSSAALADSRVAFELTGAELPLVLDDVTVTPVTGRFLTEGERLEVHLNDTSNARAITASAPRADLAGTRYATGAGFVVPPHSALVLVPLR